MPLYEYKCEKCEVVSEHYTPSYDKTENVCPMCGEKSVRVDKVYANRFTLQGEFH